MWACWAIIFWDVGRFFGFRAEPFVWFAAGGKKKDDGVGMEKPEWNAG